MPSDQLLEQLKKYRDQHMPSNQDVVDSAIEQVIGNRTASEVRESFSKLLDEIHECAYSTYLNYEQAVSIEAFRHVLMPLLPPESNADDLMDLFGKNFSVLDKYFLSLKQSRSSRAGKAFEKMIRGMFDKLGYPYTDQPSGIDGKPDFVLPSVCHYQGNPQDCIVFTCKQTTRERWTQVLTEGSRARGIYLATRQETTSENQLAKMRDKGVTLVVSKQLKESSYSNVTNVVSFEDFFLDNLDPAMQRWQRNGVLSD